MEDWTPTRGDLTWFPAGRWIDASPNRLHRQIVQEPFVVVGHTDAFDVIVRVNGGGITGQAGAVRLGVARALNSLDVESYRPALKRVGMRTRGQRVVKRKKAGLKKARKAPQ